MAFPSVLEGAVEASAAPDDVRVALARLGDTHPALGDELASDADLKAAVVGLCAASRSLTRTLVVDRRALDVLRHLGTPVAVAGAVDEHDLARLKHRELLRIAARDITGTDDLPATTAALSDLAAAVLAAASRLAGEDAEALAVIAMGKLGGAELNYASDIDILFVAPDGHDIRRADTAAREIMRIARRGFRIDATLRPEGRNGALTRSVAAYETYWSRWAEPWEFQALLKARPVAGNTELGAAFADVAAEHLWAKAFSADELRSLRTLKARAEAEVARAGLDGREIKRGAGGIRDIEFTVQLLQLVHGRHDPDLRSPTTLVTLAELGRAGYIASEDAADLDHAYRFLRTVEHRLQLVDEQQVHTVPEGAPVQDRIARGLGYRSGADATARAQLASAIAETRSTVRAIHQRVYFRPLLEAFAGAQDLAEVTIEDRLAAFGFTDAERTRQAVVELTRGLSRRSRLMAQLMPLLLGWLAESPDPDGGLLALRTLASGAQRSTELARTFRESPESARRLCTVVGTSALVADILARNPDLVPALGDDRALGRRDRAELVDTASALVSRRDADHVDIGLRRFKEREVATIAGRDLLGRARVAETGADLAAVAEAAVAVALEAVEPTVPFAVVAMGRFGGAELSYASDLDLLFVFEGGDGADDAEAERVATSLLRLVTGSTPARRIFQVDLTLRPEGRQGALARTVEAYEAYFERWAAVWERQAMIRTRPVAGDLALGQRLVTALHPRVWDDPLTSDDEREIRRIKARIERERMPRGDDPEFHLKLGRGSLSDIEWCAQLLQLRHRVETPATLTALERLVEGGHLDGEDARVLSEAYRFCEHARNRLYLVQGRPAGSLPPNPDVLAVLARSLEMTPAGLREHYRRLTRRSRNVFERLFYGRDDGPPGSPT